MMMDQFNMPAAAVEAKQRIETPQQAQELCSRLLRTAAELISVLDRETSLLRKGDANELTSLIARKTALGSTMMKDMSAINAHAAYIGRVVPEQIEALKDQHAQFKRSLRINHEALGAVKAISETLMRTIAGAAGSAKAGPETYGHTAVMRSDRPAVPAALSINRSA
jgi:hypothetical protein